MIYKRFFSVFCVFFLCSGAYIFPQNDPDRPLRSINEIFPALDAKIREQVFSSKGYIVSHQNGQRTVEAPGIDPYLRSRIDTLKPSVVVECLLVIPYPSGAMNPLDIYNGLRKIRGLGGRLYHSATRDADIPLFEDATRLETSRRTSPVKDDPPPQSSLPDSET
ncbi:MAG: hypothetical protein LBP74_01270, partial [Treponema sp.]|nr:hypothetical protein [Treponema sp.]